jgi:predicted nucleic acid-binding protein
MASASPEHPILVDTGPIVAMLSASDQYHDACVEQLQKIRGRLITCWPVITEAAWLLKAHPRAVRTLLSSFGELPFELAALADDDLPGIAAILARYKTLRLQLADASLVHLANRESIRAIFTLDRRDFTVVRLIGGGKLSVIS